VVTGLGGKVGNSAAGRKSPKPAARDEVEAEGKDSRVFKDAISNGRRDVRLFLEGIEIDGARGKHVVEGLEGEPGGKEVAEERLVKSRSQDTGFDGGREKKREGVESMKKGSPVESVGVEVSSHDGGTRRNTFEQKSHLARAGTPGGENLEMRVGNGEGPA